MGERSVDLSAYVPPDVKGGSISGGQLQVELDDEDDHFAAPKPKQQAPVAAKPTPKTDPAKQKPPEAPGASSTRIEKHQYTRPSSYTCVIAGHKNPKNPAK